MILTKVNSYFVTSNLIKEVCRGIVIIYNMMCLMQWNLMRGYLILAMNWTKKLQPYADKLDNGEITQDEYDNVHSELTREKIIKNNRKKEKS